MGVLPLVFTPGENAESLGFDGSETLHIEKVADLRPRQHLLIRLVKADGSETAFTAICRLDTEIEISYFMHGGILPMSLGNWLKRIKRLPAEVFLHITRNHRLLFPFIKMNPLWLFCLQ